MNGLMQPSGHTTPFAVLGHPIGHTLSPPMHNAAFAELGMDALYLAFDVHPDRLMSVLPAMRDMGFGGVNLTIPLKEVAHRALADLDISATRLGAVNTVEFHADGIRGHNTDGAGFLLALREAFGTGVSGLDIFVIGAGGAGRAVALTCAAEGAGRVVLADIDESRASNVAAETARQSPGTESTSLPAHRTRWESAARDADLVVHATPVGMREGDKAVLPPESFREGQMAFDLVYMYPETVFMKAASRAGARTANGLGMLLHQGAKAFTIWTGRKAAVEAMRGALREKVYGKH